jgi:thiamine pyrophosphate-dependent acetolactate synthase large subunit-like protein
VIATRSQQAATLTAGAHNYFAGDLVAAVVVSSGPAVSNCTTGILVARDNHWPLLVIGGRRSTSAADTGAFQELDGARLFESITKRTALVVQSSELGRQIDECIQIASRGRPGPCYLDVTEDALFGQSSWQELPIRSTEPDPGLDLNPVVLALQQAKRPVLIIGDELRWGDPWENLRSLVETWRLPFVTSPDARGFLPDFHALNGTTVRGWLLHEADLVLMLGASLNWMFRHGAEIRPETPVIRLGLEVDSVLTARGGHVQITGRAADSLRALVVLSDGQGREYPDGPEWITSFSRQKQTFENRLLQATEDRDKPLTPACWLKEVSYAVPKDAITVLDGNIVMAWSSLLLPVNAPVSRLTAGNNGCMGSGVPFGMAAAAAQPDCPVLVVCGDFALGLSVMELETAVRHDLPIVVIVGNNHGNGGRLRQETFWSDQNQEPVWQFTLGVRYDLMMRAMGGEGIFIEHIKEIAPAIRDAFSTRRPTLIQIDTRDDVPLPDSLVRSGLETGTAYGTRLGTDSK